MGICKWNFYLKWSSFLTKYLLNWKWLLHIFNTCEHFPVLIVLLNKTLIGRRKKRAKSETTDKDGGDDAAKTPQDGDGGKSEGGEQGETAEGEGAEEENPEDKQPKTVRE